MPFIFSSLQWNLANTCIVSVYSLSPACRVCQKTGHLFSESQEQKERNLRAASRPIRIKH